MTREDICNRLGIPLVNDKSELKAIWRKLMLRYHPDRNKAPNAEKAFIEIQKLFEALEKSFNEVQPQFVRINVNPGYGFGTASNDGRTYTWSF